MATVHATFSDNATTNTNVGDITTDHGLTINYGASRGTDYQAGTISILSKVATVDWNWSYFATDIGMTLTTDISGNNIRLVAVVDNSSVNDVIFNYNITIITL
jgi:hypothetical protein